MFCCKLAIFGNKNSIFYLKLLFLLPNMLVIASFFFFAAFYCKLAIFASKNSMHILFEIAIFA